MRRRGIVEKWGWEKGTRKRECDKVNGRSQEHATFTHRVHLNVCVLRHLASYYEFSAAIIAVVSIVLKKPNNNNNNFPLSYAAN